MFAFTCEDPPPLTLTENQFTLLEVPVSPCSDVSCCRCINSEGLLLTHLLMEKSITGHFHMLWQSTLRGNTWNLFHDGGKSVLTLWVWHGNVDEPFSRLQTAASISNFLLISRSQDAAACSSSSRLAAMTLTKTHFIVWNFVNFHADRE